MLTEANFKNLEEKGYTVVKDVLTEEECDVAIADYRAWLAHFGDSFPKTFNSIIKDHNVAHLEVTWRLRLRAKPVFAQLWKTEKLSTSFDAIAIGRPPEDGDEDFQDTRKYWLHADHSPAKVGIHGYQGSLYLEEQVQSDWTFQVMEGSHKLLNDFYEKFSERADSARKHGHQFMFADEDIEYFQNGRCRLTRVPVPKGGFLLWDSRLVHANARPLLNREHKGRWRFLTFISMTPAIWANERDIEKHQEAYRRPATTTHCSSQGILILETLSDSDIPHPTTVPEIARSEEAMKLSAMLSYDYNDGKPNGDEFRPVWKLSSNDSLPPELDQEKKWANGHI